MSIMDTIEKKTKQTVLKTAFDLIDKNPEKNIDKFIELIKKNMKDEEQLEKFEEFESIFMETESMKLYIEDILKNTNKTCMKKIIYNFIGNHIWFGSSKREKLGEKVGRKIPFTLLVTPSMRCNLRCVGCDTASYSKKDDLQYEEMDKIVKECKELGVYYIVILGGESFFNDYLMEIYNKYPDVMFMPLTNGTLFNDKVAERLANMGNVFPIISLDGDEIYIDKIRGRGVFQSIIYSMQILKKNGIPFGVYTNTKSDNVKNVISDDFLDLLIKKGARAIMYSPINLKGDTIEKYNKSVLSPGERFNLGNRSKEIRNTKEILTIDLFNDVDNFNKLKEEDYFYHINSRGMLSNCRASKKLFGNIKEKSIREILEKS